MWRWIANGYGAETGDEGVYSDQATPSGGGWISHGGAYSKARVEAQYPAGAADAWSDDGCWCRQREEEEKLLFR